MKTTILYLRAIRQANDLTTTLRQLESELLMSPEAVDERENIASIRCDAEDVFEDLKSSAPMRGAK